MINQPNFVVLIHRIYDKGVPKTGGLDIVLDQLIIRKKSILYIESPLLPSAYPFITVSLRNSEGKTEVRKFNLISNISVVARFQEILLLLYLPIKYKVKKIPCITSDPLTTAPIALLRKLGIIDYIYYHCIDYSEKRFPNKIINFIYKSLLNFSLHNVDLVGCVTKRIEVLLQDRDIKNLFYIPNSPSMSEYSNYFVPLDKRIKNKLVVTCAGISKKYRIIETVDLFKNILAKFPDATLVLIGSTVFEKEEYEEAVEHIKKLQLADKIKLTGQLNKQDNIKELCNSYIGLAFYDKSYSHVNFGDSLKIREYAALGIPTVSDKTTPTSLEMETWNAGIAVDEPWDAFDPIVRLLKDSQFYNQTMQKALVWANSVNKDTIVDKLLTDHLEKHAKN